MPEEESLFGIDAVRQLGQYAGLVAEPFVAEPSVALTDKLEPQKQHRKKCLNIQILYQMIILMKVLDTEI